MTLLAAAFCGGLCDVATFKSDVGCCNVVRSWIGFDLVLWLKSNLYFSAMCRESSFQISGPLTASMRRQVARELRAKATITENGKRRRVSKLAANTKQIVNQGASGEIKAAKMALDFAMRAQKEAEPVIEAPPLSRSDREIVERFLARLRLTELTQAASETTEPDPSKTPTSPTSEENPDADA